jgi:hypothetical protein
MDDNRVQFTKGGIAIGGAAASKAAEAAHSWTLADLASLITIAYVGLQLGCFICDRFIAPWLKARKARKKG